MTITNLRTYAGSPYKTKLQIAKECELSPRTVQERIKELEGEKERYGRHAVIRDGNIVLINYLAWVDYIANRKNLLGKNTRKYVPEYSPREIAEEIGYYKEL